LKINRANIEFPAAAARRVRDEADARDRRLPSQIDQGRRPPIRSPQMTAALSRRTALAGSLCLCCAPRPGRAAAPAMLQEIDRGIFVRRGLDEEASAANRNAIANIGFIVGDRSVLVTDPGGSLADGRWLRAEIRKRTDKPVSHVVMSHVHPDHCFGAAAFAGDAPAFVGHRKLRAALATRGDYYRKRLLEVMPADQVGEVVYPTLEVAEVSTVDLGGRTIRLTAHGTAHSSCDLSLQDGRSGILFPADLLFVGRVPSLDGSLLGWLKELDRLKASGAARATPGHGPPVVPFAPALADLTRYLTGLRDETRKAIADGRSLDQAAASASQAERGDWRLFDEYNARNVTEAYKELEWE
jgi:quinoprotein relay system zinc metallohydrolase 2